MRFPLPGNSQARLNVDIPYYHVDAFADDVFGGNPAGVCLLDNWPSDALLQRIAAENNLPETAFVVAGGDSHELRWFTPKVEIDLCGHATLATAFVLALKNTQGDAFRFSTQSGILTVRKQDDLFVMDFPARPAAPCPIPEQLMKGLGSCPRSVLKGRDYLAIFDSEQEVADLSPDFDLLATLDSFGIIVTAPGTRVDFVSRFFAPGAGIPEDPVTGSSHTTLIPYWAEQTGKQELRAKQLSRRGGDITCRANGNRVGIGGKAILYQTGRIRI